MGALKLPTSGLVYIDTMTLIYSVECYPAYWSLLEPLWQAAQSGIIQVVSSELTIMEALVGPLNSGNTALEKIFEQTLLGTEMSLLPIMQLILREVARLRATTKVRTPDALHAATAQQADCLGQSLASAAAMNPDSESPANVADVAGTRMSRAVFGKCSEPLANCTAASSSTIRLPCTTDLWSLSRSG